MVHVVIILGCRRALRNPGKQTEITVYSHVYSRLVKALEVYNNIQSFEKFIICSGINESYFMKEFLKNRGVPDNRILTENRSRNTIENCIFSYDLLTEELKNLPDFIDTKNNVLHLVTNDYHTQNG